MGFIDNLTVSAREARKNEILSKFTEPEPVKESAEDRANRFAKETVNEAAESIARTTIMREQKILNNAKRLNEIKAAAITECFMVLWEKSASLSIVGDAFAKNVARTTISAQIAKEGPSIILKNMRNKSVLMCEMANCVDTLLEKCSKVDDEECDEEKKDALLAVDPTAKSEFFKDIDNVADVDDISQSIKTRVSDAVSDFVNTTAANKAAIEDVINDIKDKTASASMPEEVKEEFKIRGNAAIDKINRRDKNLFGMMAKNMSESALLNDQLKAVLVENGRINFDKIMIWVESAYTVLETFNTTKMIKFTPELVAEVANSYKV